MQIVLKIPELVDINLQDINSRVNDLQTQLTTVNNDITTLKSRPLAAAAAPAAAPPAAAPPAAAPRGPGGPPPGGPGGPPPGGPGGPPPGGPGGPGGPRPAPARPAKPVSLRGAIMGELKAMFKSRRQS